MHYPWWYIPNLTAPMLIAIVSVIHVLVAHYAVGGGLFLAVETTYAYRSGNREYLAYLKRHAKFFVLLTVVFGAITGVGIWWTIGLASPLATAVLIRTFVFAWGTEWVFFVIEIASAFVFYYYWGRLPEKTHTTAVWLYGISAWASLVIISAITAFMLDPRGAENIQSFWAALFNVQTVPQIIARTGGALLLSSLYVYLHGAITINSAKEPGLHKLIEKRSTRPALLGAVLITLGGALWYMMLPDSARDAMQATPVLNVIMAVLFAATGVVFVLLFLGPYRNPGWIQTPGFAASLLLFGIAGFTAGEFIREAIRKPYIVYNVVLGNQVLVDEVRPLQEKGYLEGGVWTRQYVKDHYPEVCVADAKGDRLFHVNNAALLALPAKAQADLGGVIFQYHCNDCHAIQKGYSAVGPLIQGWSPERIRDVIRHLDSTRYTMPPWCGTKEEVELVGKYLDGVRQPRPAGMLPISEKPAQEVK